MKKYLFRNKYGIIPIKKIIHMLDKWGFRDTPVDKDGLYGGLVLPLPQAHFLYRLSHISLISGTYGMYRGYYDLAMVPIGIYFTSINYWKYPKATSIRRYVDISYVILSFTYQHTRTMYAENMIPYWGFILMAFLCYPLGRYFKNENAWIGTFFHSGCHIFSNIANIIIYSGEIP